MSASALAALQIALLFPLAALAGVLADNLSHFRRLPPIKAPPDAPRVSVLVPARNEAAVLDACLGSLRAQHYPSFEIQVLDDASTDETPRIVRRHAAADPRVRLLEGAPLPLGWTGKCYACHQLSQSAEGDLLLFVDADVRLAPDALASAVSALVANEAGLLSLFPEQETKTLGERLTVPLLSFILLCFLPMRLAAQFKLPSLSAANGQFMLFRKGAYQKIGGHAAVRGALVEDIQLARNIKAAGERLSIADGTGLVACRMYRSWKEAYLGFSKNLYPAFGGSASSFWGALAMLFGCFMWPWLTLPWGGVASLAAIALGLGMRLAIALRLRQALLTVVLHPLAMAALILIALRSFAYARSGRSAPWKGRTYGPAAGSDPTLDP
ncbi:glycosyltransferase [bacterium]|nr:glycosyltransferase [bacterium]